uniref:Uncharacterized protein n=1 Tax=viral metagenome TaxID=1070528 RepID=A0A6C0AEL2_9ZZZZ
MTYLISNFFIKRLILFLNTFSIFTIILLSSILIFKTNFSSNLITFGRIFAITYVYKYDNLITVDHLELINNIYDSFFIIFISSLILLFSYFLFL